VVLEAIDEANARLFAAFEEEDVQALTQSPHGPQYRCWLMRGLRNCERMVNLMAGSTNEHS